MPLRKMTCCPLCGGRIEEVVITQLPSRKRDGSVIVFGNVPAERCVSCGERFYAPDTAWAMEEVLEGRKKVRSKIELPFYEIQPRKRAKVAS